jgi:redox-sensing transcriptional repressor
MTPLTPFSKPVPEPTLRRLPLYHRFLKEVEAGGRESISCTDIGLHLKLDPTQVRKDLQAAGIEGRPRIGYALCDVVNGIEQFLGWKNVHETFLVGAGSMGAALLGYKKFEQCGLNIVAAFDADPLKAGTQIHGKRVLPLEQLVDLAQRMHILMGIITVPAAAAQGVAELMVRGGIRALWNFAPIRLRVPDHIIVHNEDLYCSLASLSQKLAKALQAYPMASLWTETSAAAPTLNPSYH